MINGGDGIRIIQDLSWSEKELPQKERTKHVHSLHQYFGKFVPQLVDYFLERDLKNSKFICDPFMGSGTTLVESNIHNIPSIGLDVSEFNVLMCNVKTTIHDTIKLKQEVHDILDKTVTTLNKNNLDNYISARDRKKIFSTKSKYLKTWYHKEALQALLAFREFIPNYHNQDVLKIILSRAARSSRMVPHHEVDFPKKPQTDDYYCMKHDRICHPTKNALAFLTRYCHDVVNRIQEFQQYRNDVYTKAVCADSRYFDFSEFKKIDGVFTSPPYVGLIDYHEQHRYSYELLDLEDRSESEIGRKSNGASKHAVANYKRDMIKTVKNIAESVLDKKNGVFIIVVNDKLNIYEDIMQDAGLEVTERLRRSVDRRTGRRATKFYEDIIIWKGSNVKRRY